MKLALRRLGGLCEFYLLSRIGVCLWKWTDGKGLLRGVHSIRLG
jgi:hypothetical protein